MSEQAPGTHERGVAVIDVSEVKTEPLGEALPEAVVEQPQPTIFEHAYWDQEGERVDREVEAILDRPLNKMEPLQFAECVNFVWTKTDEDYRKSSASERECSQSSRSDRSI